MSRVFDDEVSQVTTLLERVTQLNVRYRGAGFEFLSTLIEERLRDTGPPWFREAAVLNRIENYLQGGTPFAYLQVGLRPSNA